MIQNKKPRRHSEALNHYTIIINHKSPQNQDVLWSQFQELAMRSQQNPTQGNIMQATLAHKIWAASFLGNGGNNV